MIMLYLVVEKQLNIILPDLGIALKQMIPVYKAITAALQDIEFVVQASFKTSAGPIEIGMGDLLPPRY